MKQRAPGLENMLGLTIGISQQDGEAKLTQKTRERIKEAIAEDPLFMADVLQDCMYEYAEMYDLAVEALHTSWAISHHTRGDKH